MSTEPQPCLHVDWETKLGFTIAQSRLAYFHLEYLVLSPKAEPNPFSSPLPVCVGEEGNAILASPAQGGYVTSTRRWEKASPTYVLSVGCGEDQQGRKPSPRAGFPTAGGEKGKEGAFQILLGTSRLSGPRSPGPPICPSPSLHSHTLPDLTIPTQL